MSSDLFQKQVICVKEGDITYNLSHYNYEPIKAIYDDLSNRTVLPNNYHLFKKDKIVVY